MAATRLEAFDQACNILREHFDAGMLAVTWEELGETKLFKEDFGNSYAVRGLREELMICNDLENVEEDLEEELN